MYSFPARYGLGDPGWLDPVTSVVIVLISLVAALVLQKLLFPLLLRATRWTPSDLDTRLLTATRRPVTVAVVLLGVYLALVVPVDLDAGQRDTVDTVFGLLGIIIGVLVVVALVSKTIDWYLEYLAARSSNVVDLNLFPLLRRISVVLIYGLGALLIMDILKINISPLIAGLGLGGLAVALAIQPTLANLFAGTYVMTEGVISPGDYIELEGSVSGYVVEVGWRSTRIRTWKNNLVVVPNARFAETIITNYQQPAPAVNVWLNCGISYDSDLDRVEEVCRKVMDELLETEPKAVKEYGGWFGYDNFGDSNVNFWLFIQAKDRWGSFEVQSALMKRLHQRFKQENITINYPMRTLQLPEEWDPKTVASSDGREPAERVDGKNPRRSARRRKRPPRLRVPRSFGEETVSGGDGPDPGQAVPGAIS